MAELHEDKWERVEKYTMRLKVPSGWIYEVYWFDRNTTGTNVVFVPDAATKGDDE